MGDHKPASNKTASVRRRQPNNWEKVLAIVSTIAYYLFRGTIGLALFGFLLNWTLLKYEKNHLEPIGRLVTLDDNTTVLNYYCIGNSKLGDPVFFLVPGADSVYISYGNLLNQISKNHKICTYDRQNRLFSTGTVNQTSAETNIADLKKVIRHANGDENNIVLIGHSLGANLAACFSFVYPQKGLILMDPIPIHSKQLYDQLLEEPKTVANWMHIMTILGIMRGTIYYSYDSFVAQIPTVWHPHWTYTLNSAHYWNLGENQLWEPITKFLLDKQQKQEKLNNDILLLRSSYFGRYGDTLWQDMWLNETYFQEEISTEKVKKITIPGSDHTFTQEHHLISKELENYAKSLRN